MTAGRHRCTPNPCDACAMLDVYDSEQRRTFERVTVLRLALRDALEFTEALQKQYSIDGNDLEPIADKMRAALEQDGAA